MRLARKIKASTQTKNKKIRISLFLSLVSTFHFSLFKLSPISRLFSSCPCHHHVSTSLFFHYVSTSIGLLMEYQRLMATQRNSWEETSGGLPYSWLLSRLWQFLFSFCWHGDFFRWVILFLKWASSCKHFLCKLFFSFNNIPIFYLKKNL